MPRKQAGSARHRLCPSPPHGHRCEPHLQMRSHLRRGHAGGDAGISVRNLRVPDGAPAAPKVGRLVWARDARKHWPHRYASREPDRAHDQRSLTMGLFRHPWLVRGIVHTPHGAFTLVRGLVEMPDEIGETLGWPRSGGEEATSPPHSSSEGPDRTRMEAN